MTAHSVLNVRAAPEWGNSELYKYYERNGLGYGTFHLDDLGCLSDAGCCNIAEIVRTPWNCSMDHCHS